MKFKLSWTMSLTTLRRCLSRSSPIISKIPNTRRSIHHKDSDSCGIPLQPTWSVNELLSSYPSPKLSPATINRLYELSALQHPEESTPYYESLKSDLEDLIKLVEAVRLVDTTGIKVSGRDERQDADRRPSQGTSSEENGQALLKYASQTSENYYVVDFERKTVA